MSWYETQGLGRVGTAELNGVTYTRVEVDVSGAKCICYDADRQDLAPVSRSHTFEGTFGGKRYFCGCYNRASGSTMTLPQIGSLIQTDAFKDAAAQAVAAELGVSAPRTLVRTVDYEARRRRNVLVLGIGGVLLGSAAGLFLFMRAAKGTKRGTHA
jgi:hypothetical protein